MRRRVWAALLALVLLCALSACSRSADTEYDVRVDVDPATLSDNANILLRYFGWYTGAGYDAADITAETNVLACDFPHAVDFDSYPGPAAEWRENSDPRGRYGTCMCFDGEKTDWILTHIFHYTDEDIDEMQRMANLQALSYYYSGGVYYIQTGGVGGGHEVQFKTVQTDGEKYYVTYDIWFGDGEMQFVGTQYAVLGIEEIDGAYYWTLYEWSSEVPETAAAPAEEAAQDDAAAPDPAEEAAAQSPWLGTWAASDGDTITITDVQDTYVLLTHSSLDEAGTTMHHTDYMLGYTDETKTVIAEDPSVVQTRGYRLIFTLHDGVITLSSRYPDQDFYKQ